MTAAVQLDFADLQAFELVQDQYRQQGVRFVNAIAVSPSNPAFAAHLGNLVLMPITSASGITANFVTPVQMARITVTSTRPLYLSAYDIHGSLIGQTSTRTYRCLQTSADLSTALPQHTLHLKAAGIARIEVSSDAPFTLDAFCY